MKKINLFLLLSKLKNKAEAAEAIGTYQCVVHSHACTSVDYYKIFK